MTTNDKIQGLVLLLKVNGKTYEVFLSDLVKKEIYQKIDALGIRLIDNPELHNIKIK